MDTENIEAFDKRLLKKTVISKSTTTLMKEAYYEKYLESDHTYKQVTSLPATEQMITALPDIKKLEIDAVKDEFIVLACDGIWNFMSSQDVVDFIRPRLNEKKKISSICEELFDHCLAPDTMGDGTGCDNMTCIIVKFKPAGINGHESVKRPAASLEETAEQIEDNSIKRQKLDNETPTADTEVSVDK